MRFTRYSSDGDSVVQERIRLHPQPGEHKPLINKEAPDVAGGLDDGGGAGARFASSCRVLAGIDELLRNAATPA